MTHWPVFGPQVDSIWKMATSQIGEQECSLSKSVFSLNQSSTSSLQESHVVSTISPLLCPSFHGLRSSKVEWISWSIVLLFWLACPSASIWPNVLTNPDFRRFCRGLPRHLLNHTFSLCPSTYNQTHILSLLLHNIACGHGLCLQMRLQKHECAVKNAEFRLIIKYIIKCQEKSV